ncbi:hypothetical protein L1887_36510 [Cichorium endivia]|nr:hypothetical protein L1887_36510 [Cichorium endivia]
MCNLILVIDWFVTVKHILKLCNRIKRLERLEQFDLKLEFGGDDAGGRLRLSGCVVEVEKSKSDDTALFFRSLLKNPRLQRATGLIKTLTPSSFFFQIQSMATSDIMKIQIQRENSMSFSYFFYLLKCTFFYTFDVYVDGKEDAPGIVVLQERCLYRGKVGHYAAEAQHLMDGLGQHLMDGLDWPGAIKDIQASVNYIKSNGSQKVGVAGYWMGGTLVIASSLNAPSPPLLSKAIDVFNFSS